MDEEVLDAFQRLGLTTYEARVYIALEKLQSATASDIANVSDVPRSQVYQTASALEDRGFIEIQQSNPTRYRVVPVEEIRRQFEEQFRSDEGRVFEYVDSIQGTLAESDEESPSDIWTVRGRPNVTKRSRELLGDASDSVVYGARPDLLASERDITEQLGQLADHGVTVNVLVGADATVELPDGVSVIRVPDERIVGAPTGRILVVDRSALLLSVVAAGSEEPIDDEKAIWSADTDFANVLILLFEEWVGDLCG